LACWQKVTYLLDICEEYGNRGVGYLLAFPGRENTSA